MSNLLSKTFSDIKDAVEVPIPPAFQPLSIVILPKPGGYKKLLKELISNAPSDLSDNEDVTTDWWKKLGNITTAKADELLEVKKGVKELMGQTRDKVENSINNLANDNNLSKDKTLMKMIEMYKDIVKSDAELKKIYEKQAQIAERMQKIVNKLEKNDTAKSRVKQDSEPREIAKDNESVNPSTPSTPSTIATSAEAKDQQASEGIVTRRGLSCQDTLVTEGLAIDMISKMAGMFNSPQLTLLMAKNRFSEKNSNRLARSVIYNVLLKVSERAYGILEKEGISRKQLARIYRDQHEVSSKKLIIRARELFGHVDQTTETKTKKKTDTRGKPVAQNKPVGPAAQRVFKKIQDRLLPDENEKPVIDTKPKKSQTAKPGDGVGLVKEEPVVKKKPTTPGAVIYRKMMDAARNSENPIQAAEMVLTKYEDLGIPEASIVRRMFERSSIYST